jgi:hypothetical protein
LEPKACERFVNPIGCKLRVATTGEFSLRHNVPLTGAAENH